MSTATLDPETSRSVEAGTKWDLFGGRLGLNTAVFNTSKTNARTPGVNPGDPPTVLQGEHTVSGVERINPIGPHRNAQNAAATSNC